MIRAHAIALDPNDKQATHLAKAAGVARFAYNWALTEWGRQYRAHTLDASLPKPSQAALRRQLNSVKRVEFPWMSEVTKCAPQMAIIHLGDAFQNFFTRKSRYPTYRKKGVDDRFTLTNDQFAVSGKRVRIPKLGWVRMREELRFEGKILSSTVSRRAGRWFISITVDVASGDVSAAVVPSPENQGVVGVDLGVATLAVLSTGERVVGPKAHTALLARQRRLARSLARKRRGSKNRSKAKGRLAKLHARIANVRLDATHKLTSRLVNEFGTVVIEDLNVSGMMKNRRLARSISDASFREVRRQLEYKCAERGKHLVIADRWFASSKTCSVCGQRRAGLMLSQRSWVCACCGSLHDRDLNAAMNLAAYAASSAVSACGGEGSGVTIMADAKPAPAKQEVNSVLT